ncbi:Proline/betaine transporter [BD1-7 clade bacterium]|uniref:Proline/betaine transporter n=1 Tax=BD1-7 clade bacterium TaxID=2029982 RepID=A0A5S9NP53_9GAMM|nr:Proline/betaine transporter [BD1-7 clade bacterium]
MTTNKTLLLCGFGGMLEFYDFIIYALLASILAEQFFPTGDAITSILATFATFALGYLVRPIGGFIFGHFGDVYGRKNTFMMTVLLMALSTLLIAFVPSYQQIGITGTLLLIILRIVQGLSIGGEIPGAITYISECVPKHQRGFTSGVIFFFLANGVTLGTLAHWWLSGLLSAESFHQWGWRLLFVIGGVLGFINYLLRKRIQESPVFENLTSSVRFPLSHVIRFRKRITFFGVLITGSGAAMITTYFLFIPGYLKIVLPSKPDGFLFASVVGCFTSTLIILLFGYLSDRFNRRWLISGSLLASILLALPIFNSWVSGDLWIPMLAGATLYGTIWGVIPSILPTLFDTEIRFSGVATCYNLGFALFAGLGPLICFYLIHITGLPDAPAYYLMVVCGAALVVALLSSVASKAQS